eukprot:sb/3467146/
MKYVYTITDVKSSFQGSYSCKITYEDGSSITSNPALLSIYNIEVSEAFGIIGGSVTLTCTIISDQEPASVSWTKENNVIPGLTPVNDYSGSSRTTTNKITFNSLTKSDFGTYGCIAYFDDFSSVLTAEGAKLTELKFITVIEEVIYTKGESITLSCTVNQPSSLSVEATISMYKDSSLVTGATLSTVGESRSLSLVFNSIDPTDAGNYKCQAAYASIDGTLESDEVEVFVRGLTTQLDSTLYMVAGESQTVTCVGQTETSPVVSCAPIGCALHNGCSQTTRLRRVALFILKFDGCYGNKIGNYGDRIA